MPFGLREDKDNSRADENRRESLRAAYRHGASRVAILTIRAYVGREATISARDRYSRPLIIGDRECEYFDWLVAIAPVTRTCTKRPWICGRASYRFAYVCVSPSSPLSSYIGPSDTLRTVRIDDGVVNRPTLGTFREEREREVCSRMQLSMYDGTINIGRRAVMRAFAGAHREARFARPSCARVRARGMQ